MKTEVYSWRVSADIKTGLERAARRRKVSLSKLLDMAAQEFLKSSDSEGDDDETQRRLHKAASESFGSMASGDTRRSETASATVRQRLRRHYGR
jgi:hypothetical protein